MNFDGFEELGFLGQETQAQRDPLGRQFFESSVYRNVQSITTRIEHIAKRFENDAKDLIKDTYSYWGEPKVVGWAINKTGKKGKSAFLYHIARPILKPGFNKKQWIQFAVSNLRGGGMRPQVEVPKSINQTLINTRTVAHDLSARVRNLELELNRLHLPMPENFGSWAETLENYVRALPANIPRLPRVEEFAPIPQKISKEIREKAADTAVRAAQIYFHIQKLIKSDLPKIRESLKKAELRSEELKRQQQEQAEKAYQEKLRKQREEKARKAAEEQARKAAEEKARKVAKEKAKKTKVSTMPVKKPDTQKLEQLQAKYQQAVSQLEAQKQKADNQQRAEMQRQIDALKNQAQRITQQRRYTTQIESPEAKLDVKTDVEKKPSYLPFILLGMGALILGG